jgi:HD superfamily phosphohydrolase
MDGLCLEIIDTPQFQRLGYICQLGACPLVYRGATHTRWVGRESVVV